MEVGLTSYQYFCVNRIALVIHHRHWGRGRPRIHPCLEVVPLEVGLVSARICWKLVRVWVAGPATQIGQRPTDILLSLTSGVAANIACPRQHRLSSPTPSA